MSDKLGNVDLASNHEQLSTGTKELIETEVRRVIEEARVRATQLISSRRKELDYLAKALVDHETLNREEAFKVIKGEKLDKPIMPTNQVIKVPDMGSVGGLPDVPKLPGSRTDDEKGNPGPGGVVA